MDCLVTVKLFSEIAIMPCAIGLSHRRLPCNHESFQQVCSICTVAIIVEHDNNQCNLSFRVCSHGNMITISVTYHLEYVAMVT